MGENIEMSRLSTKTKLVIRFSILFLCIAGLFTQSAQLLFQYLKGQTVVYINIETIKYNRIPAITICYPQYLSMERTAQKYPHLKPLFDDYKRVLKTVSDTDFKNETLRQYMNGLFRQNFSSFVDEQELSVSELHDLSIPFVFPINSSLFVTKYKRSLQPIEIKVEGMRLYPNGSVSDETIVDTQPIESIIFPNFGKSYKCFTFFSHLNKSLRVYQMDVQSISIEVNSKII